MSTDGIDGCWIGPSDLAASMGVPFNSPEHLTTIDQIVEICKQTNKIPGISDGPPNFSTDEWLSKGCLFVTAGVDLGWMLDGCKSKIGKLKNHWQPNKTSDSRDGSR